MVMGMGNIFAITAVPDLVEALEASLDVLEGRSTDAVRAVEMARKAIVKARGQN
jgi:hypothetical protein